MANKCFFCNKLCFTLPAPAEREQPTYLGELPAVGRKPPQAVGFALLGGSRGDGGQLPRAIGVLFRLHGFGNCQLHGAVEVRQRQETHFRGRLLRVVVVFGVLRLAVLLVLRRVVSEGQVRLSRLWEHIRVVFRGFFYYRDGVFKPS